MRYNASFLSKRGLSKWSCAAAVSLSIATAAWAHHSASNFDQSKQYIFRGTVKTLKWINPHVWLYVDVQKADGTTELWGYETDGPNMLIRAGINSNFAKPGDKVTVYATPEREVDKRNGFLRKIVLADGRELVPNGGVGGVTLGEGGAPLAGGPLPPGFPQPVTPVDYK